MRSDESKTTSDVAPLRQTYQLVVKGNHGKWVALLSLAVVVSLLEAGGAGLVFVLISLISDPGGAVVIPLLGDVSEWIPDVSHRELVLGVATFVGAFFVLRGALQVLQTYAQHRIAFNAGARISTRLVRGYLAMPYAYHLSHDSAELARNAISSVQETISRVVLPATTFIAEMLIVTAMTVVLFVTAPVPALLVVAIIAPATYLILKVVKSRVKAYGRMAIDSAHESLHVLQQSLGGFRDIRILARERFFADRFRRQRVKDAVARARQATFSQLASLLIETLLMLFIVVFVVFVVWSGDSSGEAFAVLGLFAYVGMRLKPSIQKIVNTSNNLRFAGPAIADLHQDLRETDTPLSDTPSSPHEPKLEFARQIRVERVSFGYGSRELPVIDDVTIEVMAGESVGVCGPTGGGKSTLIDLVSGLLKPTRGQILVDDVDIESDVRGWQSQIGVVSQAAYLFDDSLRRNIALGLPDGEVDEEAITEAVRIAQLEDFVRELPLGLDTEVGENGALLSGGQRQRVAIARALYRNPPVLILDEGTSALDNETERAFMTALEEFRGQKTIILIAHRLSTIRNCDQVIYITGGRVSGEGTFDELYEANEAFRRMAV